MTSQTAMRYFSRNKPSTQSAMSRQSVISARFKNGDETEKVILENGYDHSLNNNNRNGFARKDFKKASKISTKSVTWEASVFDESEETELEKVENHNCEVLEEEMDVTKEDSELLEHD